MKSCSASKKNAAKEEKQSMLLTRRPFLRVALGPKAGSGEPFYLHFYNVYGLASFNTRRRVDRMFTRMHL